MICNVARTALRAPRIVWHASLLGTLTLGLAACGSGDTELDTGMEESAASSEEALAAGALTGFALVDADRGSPINGFNPIANGAEIILNRMPAKRIAIIANVSGRPASVRFDLDGKDGVRTENESPFALSGNAGSVFNAWAASIGDHVLRATPFSKSNGAGNAGQSREVRFRVTESGSGNGGNDGEADGDTGSGGTDRPIDFPVGETCRGPVLGSKVIVDPSVGSHGVNSKSPIEQNIGLFTLCHGSGIGRPDFPNWSRWYQEAGNTQVFRLFTGEVNTHNARPGHPRVETYTSLKWPAGKAGEWHEFNATYHPVKMAGASVFQLFNSETAWELMIIIGANGDVKMQGRRSARPVIATGMLGKDFDIKVRDNGVRWECYYNGKLVGGAEHMTNEGNMHFRWGMYAADAGKVDSLLFVRGAHAN